MKMMPKWIADYKEERRLKRIKDKERKKEQNVAPLHIKRLGLHQKDPRAQQILNQKTNIEQPKVKKKKFGDKKKKSDF